MTTRQEIAAKIKAIRASLRLTQQEFTDAYNARWPQKELHLTRSDLSKYEVGLSLPPADKYECIKAMAEKEREDAGANAL